MTLTIILGVALGISEALSLIPAIKSNGIFQLVYNTFQAIVAPHPLQEDAEKEQTPPKAS